MNKNFISTKNKTNNHAKKASPKVKKAKHDINFILVMLISWIRFHQLSRIRK